MIGQNFLRELPLLTSSILPMVPSSLCSPMLFGSFPASRSLYRAPPSLCRACHAMSPLLVQSLPCRAAPSPHQVRCNVQPPPHGELAVPSGPLVALSMHAMRPPPHAEFSMPCGSLQSWSMPYRTAPSLHRVRHAMQLPFHGKLIMPSSPFPVRWCPLLMPCLWPPFHLGTTCYHASPHLHAAGRHHSPLRAVEPLPPGTFPFLECTIHTSTALIPLLPYPCSPDAFPSPGCL